MLTEFKEKDDIAKLDAELEAPWGKTQHRTPVKAAQQSRGTDELMKIMAAAR